jgi:hypothetical protein
MEKGLAPFYGMTTPCSSCKNRRCGGTYRLHFQANQGDPEDGDNMFLRNVCTYRITRRRHTQDDNSNFKHSPYFPLPFLKHCSIYVPIYFTIIFSPRRLRQMGVLLHLLCLLRNVIYLMTVLVIQTRDKA